MPDTVLSTLRVLTCSALLTNDEAGAIIISSLEREKPMHRDSDPGCLVSMLFCLRLSLCCKAE